MDGFASHYLALSAQVPGREFPPELAQFLIEKQNFESLYFRLGVILTQELQIYDDHPLVRRPSYLSDRSLLEESLGRVKDMMILDAQQAEHPLRGMLSVYMSASKQKDQEFEERATNLAYGYAAGIPDLVEIYMWQSQLGDQSRSKETVDRILSQKIPYRELLTLHRSMSFIMERSPDPNTLARVNARFQDRMKSFPRAQEVYLHADVMHDEDLRAMARRQLASYARRSFPLAERAYNMGISLNDEILISEARDGLVRLPETFEEIHQAYLMGRRHDDWLLVQRAGDRMMELSDDLPSLYVASQGDIRLRMRVGQRIEAELAGLDRHALSTLRNHAATYRDQSLLNLIKNNLND